MSEGLARRKALRALGRALGLGKTADGDGALLDLALTHDSYGYEHGARRGERRVELSNERLEFVGDAVVGLAAARWLYERHPSENEGRLSRRRQSLVSRSALAASAARMGLAPLLRLGKGEAARRAEPRPSILADALEAVAGAVYLCEGFAAAAKFLERTHFAHAHVSSAADPRTELQEVVQARFGRAPLYVLAEEGGPAHARVFSARVSAGDVVGTGSGPTKKQAQAAAAAEALRKLRHPKASPLG
jgi:ribonuclease III